MIAEYRRIRDYFVGAHHEYERTAKIFSTQRSLSSSWIAEDSDLQLREQGIISCACSFGASQCSVAQARSRRLARNTPAGAVMSAGSLERLLERLHAVKRQAPSQWSARCPAHNDSRPSLSIKQCDDGRILLRCFAECSVIEIVSSVGLTLSDLMPERALRDRIAPSRVRLLSPAQGLVIVAQESLLAAVCSSTMAQRRWLPDTDRERLWEAAGRIQAVYAEVRP
jgi:hypothetical protein